MGAIRCFWAWFFLVSGCAAAGSDGGGKNTPRGDQGDSGTARMDSGSHEDAERNDAGEDTNEADSGRLPPMPNPDAFFAEDPPPQYCGPDGEMGPAPEVPGGTPECPDDKNREGCPCENIGERAPCWPGLRVDRNRGICRDGVTECILFGEFDGAWGPCEDYQLPSPGATRGRLACDCFSAGLWEIDNLSPCFFLIESEASTELIAVSTYLDSAGVAQCPEFEDFDLERGVPPFQPWSTHRLRVDCPGQFELCYTLRAGDVNRASASDCVVAESCVEIWYEAPDVPQELPVLPGWLGSDPTCAREFYESGGYGEMTVTGRSVECEEIDDGAGGPYVFQRNGYCPLSCNETPTAPECLNCAVGGSGEF